MKNRIIDDTTTKHKNNKIKKKSKDGSMKRAKEWKHCKIRRSKQQKQGSESKNVMIVPPSLQH